VKEMKTFDVYEGETDTSASALYPMWVYEPWGDPWYPAAA
jgi:hypothetical protein